MFASAAIVDAIRKDERRKELDRQLEEAKRELAELREQNGRDDMSVQSSIAQLTDSQMEELWNSLRSIYTGRPHFKEIHKPAMLLDSELREKLQKEHYGCPDERSLAALRQTDMHELERAMIFEESEPSIARRDPTDRKHLQRFSDSIVMLIEQMMMRANSRRKDNLPSPSFDEALRLMIKGYPRYTFRRVDPKKAQDDIKVLNGANRTAINDPELGVKEKIGRVCYNLLVSKYPPDMHSFNTLIATFDKHRGYRHFSEAVVSTFFYNSRMMPTPSTYAAILHHYKVTGNHGRFLRAISCIAGLDCSTGAKYRRRHVGNLETDLFLQLWAADTTKRTTGGNYIWEHAPLNRLMVEEILSGLLRFNMFDHAVSFFTSCIQAGVYMTNKIVKQVLDECLVALDWKAAVLLIREFTRRRQLWASMMETRDEDTVAYLVDRIYSLLDMIGLGNSGSPLTVRRLGSLGIARLELASFMDKVFHTSLALPDALVVSQDRGDIELDEFSVASRSRLLQIESVEKEVTRVRKTIKSYESRLLKPDLTLEFRTAMAAHISSTAIQSSQRLADEAAEALNTHEAHGNIKVCQVQATEGLLHKQGSTALPVGEKGKRRVLGIRRDCDSILGNFVSKQQPVLRAGGSRSW